MSITIRWMCAFRRSSKTLSEMIIREHGHGGREVAAETIVNGSQIRHARIGVEIPADRIRRKFGQDVWSNTDGSDLRPKRGEFSEYGRPRTRMRFEAYDRVHTESFCVPGEIKSIVLNCRFEELSKHEKSEIKIALNVTGLPLTRLVMHGKKATLEPINLPKGWL